jgi:hypothetical protein
MASENSLVRLYTAVYDNGQWAPAALSTALNALEVELFELIHDVHGHMVTFGMMATVALMCAERATGSERDLVPKLLDKIGLGAKVIRKYNFGDCGDAETAELIANHLQSIVMSFDPEKPCLSA